MNDANRWKVNDEDHDTLATRKQQRDAVDDPRPVRHADGKRLREAVKERCKTCGHEQEVPDVLCNLCGLSCVLSEKHFAELGGLIGARASGGYASTPGNGVGALDDTTSYTFSLCEFCLDWLFARFTIHVATSDYMADDTKAEPWRAAAERVAADDWRKMKQAFTDEAARRASAREAKKAGCE